MNSSSWIALAAVIVTVLGGGLIGVAKLTRIAVAVETLVEQIKVLTKAQAATSATVQDHEIRLNRGGL